MSSELLKILPSPFRLILHKNVEPDNTRKSKYEWRAQDEHPGKNSYHLPHARIEKHMGQDECGHPKGHREGIAYIHGAIKEGRFQHKPEPTVAAMLMHLKHFGKVIGVAALKHIALMTARAFEFENTIEFTSFSENIHLLDFTFANLW